MDALFMAQGPICSIPMNIVVMAIMSLYNNFKFVNVFRRDCSFTFNE